MNRTACCIYSLVIALLASALSVLSATAQDAAEKLVALFDELPQRLPSGEYGDLRTLTAST